MVYSIMTEQCKPAIVEKIKKSLYKKEAQNVETRNKQIKGMVTHKRWVRSGMKIMGDGDQIDTGYTISVYTHYNQWVQTAIFNSSSTP